ncbi:MAG: sporulation membrane protein YtaF [Syntrophomonadaceae bacterium]|nr:sporulation membrane protein YtaF [Syntrophomonadaceae bacterium]
MHFASMLLLALAVSADGFVVGMAYGARKIRIPIVPLLLICAASMLAIGLSMLAGRALACYFDPHWAERIGAVALMAVGAWFMVQGLQARQENEPEEENYPIATLRIRPLGIIVQILREPSRADLDSSGVISPNEAFFLGAALALDALGAGMGASLSGFGAWTIPMVGCCKFILVSLGLKWGDTLNSRIFKKWSSLIAGLLLLGLGLTGMMR